VIVVGSDGLQEGAEVMVLGASSGSGGAGAVAEPARQVTVRGR